MRWWDPDTGAQTAENNLGPGWVELVAWRPRPAGHTEQGASSKILAAAAGRKPGVLTAE